jgi:hypothetical protein
MIASRPIEVIAAVLAVTASSGLGSYCSVIESADRSAKR